MTTTVTTGIDTIAARLREELDRKQVISDRQELRT
jgi:hypothetical protein